MSAALRADIDSLGLRSYALGTGQQVDPTPFLEVMRQAGEHAVIVTAQGRNGCLGGVRAERLRALSTTPPQIAWELPAGSDSLSIFAGATHFAINLLAPQAADLQQRFEGPQHDKFAQLAFEFGQGGAPLLECAVAAIECESQSAPHAGGPTLFIGRVLKVRKA